MNLKFWINIFKKCVINLKFSVMLGEFGGLESKMKKEKKAIEQEIEDLEKYFSESSMESDNEDEEPPAAAGQAISV